MPKKVSTQDGFVSKLIEAHSAASGEGHKYVSSGKDAAGRKWTVHKSKDSTTISTAKIFDLLEKEIKGKKTSKKMLVHYAKPLTKCTKQYEPKKEN